MSSEESQRTIDLAIRYWIKDVPYLWLRRPGDDASIWTSWMRVYLFPEYTDYPRRFRLGGVPFGNTFIDLSKCRNTDVARYFQYETRFPHPFKNYIDCIYVNGRKIDIKEYMNDNFNEVNGIATIYWAAGLKVKSKETLLRFRDIIVK
jgi:hypothetical protein